MSRFEINDKDLVGLKDKVVLVTGIYTSELSCFFVLG